MRAIVSLSLGLAALLLLHPAAEADLKKKQKERAEALPPAYRTWIAEIELLISEEEFEAFMALEKDYQRDAFIKRFWQVRDPYPETTRNEAKDRWYEMLDHARAEFGGIGDDRSRYLLLNGPPASRLVVECGNRLQPMEIWFYDGGTRLALQLYLIFYRRGGLGAFRLWYPEDGVDELFNSFDASVSGRNVDLAGLRTACRDGDIVYSAIGWVLSQDRSYGPLVARIDRPAETPKGEWLATFNSFSTDVPEDAATFNAKLELVYPGRQQTRTVLQGLLKVPAREIGFADLEGHRSHNLLLNGEVLRDGELFDSFRYKFDFPVETTPGGEGPEIEVADKELPLVFQRLLRPGTYSLVLKLEDLNGKKFFRGERALEVPKLEGELPPPEPEDPETARLLREANAAITSGETTIRILAPHGDLQSGMLRLETVTTGTSFDQVTFYLDGKPVLTKRKPPYSVEVDLGALPRTRELRAVGFDAAGQELASDEMVLNAGTNRFAVRLVEPRKGKTYRESLQAQAEVQVPEGKGLARVEFYLSETLLATLYQPPYTQTILLPATEELAYVRAVAYLADGNSTEDLVFVNAPAYLEEVDVQFVELFTSVLDRDGRPVEGLRKEEFTVFEDKAEQTIARFEQVRDLPFHAGILLDVSASMDESMEPARQAALRFFQQAVTPKDRGALITFNDRPNFAVKFTNEVPALASGLAGLKAERGTALYDSLIFALYTFNGIRGQKAVLVLSDGKDESSRFTFEDTLEYARRAGITIYTIGLEDVAKDAGARRKLERLAEITGGRSFFVRAATELGPIYDAIQQELRSQYLVAYQSNNTSGETTFREVELRVSRPGVDVKTLSGYYP